MRLRVANGKVLEGTQQGRMTLTICTGESRHVTLKLDNGTGFLWLGLHWLTSTKMQEGIRYTRIDDRATA